MRLFSSFKKMIAATMAIITIGFTAVNVISCNGIPMPQEFTKIITGLSEDKLIEGVMDGNDVWIFLEAATAKFFAFLKSDSNGTKQENSRAITKPAGEPYCSGNFANKKSAETTESELFFVVTAKKNETGKCTDLPQEDVKYFSATVDFSSDTPHFTKEDVKTVEAKDYEKAKEDVTQQEKTEQETGKDTTPTTDSTTAKDQKYKTAEEKLKDAELMIELTGTKSNYYALYTGELKISVNKENYIYNYNKEKKCFEAGPTVSSWIAGALKDYQKFDKQNDYPHLGELIGSVIGLEKEYQDNEKFLILNDFNKYNELLKPYATAIEGIDNGYEFTLNSTKATDDTATIEIKPNGTVSAESIFVTIKVDYEKETVIFIEDKSKDQFISAAYKINQELYALANKIEPGDKASEVYFDLIKSGPLVPRLLSQVIESASNPEAEKVTFQVYEGTMGEKGEVSIDTSKNPVTFSSLSAVSTSYTDNYIFMVGKQAADGSIVCTDTEVEDAKPENGKVILIVVKNNAPVQHTVLARKLNVIKNGTEYLVDTVQKYLMFTEYESIKQLFSEFDSTVYDFYLIFSTESGYTCNGTLVNETSTFNETVYIAISEKSQSETSGNQTNPEETSSESEQGSTTTENKCEFIVYTGTVETKEGKTYVYTDAAVEPATLKATDEVKAQFSEYTLYVVTRSPDATTVTFESDGTLFDPSKAYDGLVYIVASKNN